MSDEPLPPDLSIETTMSGSQTYHVGGRYNGDGQFTVRLTQGNQEIPLKFLVRDAGTWELHGNILVEATGDSIITPMDKTTMDVVKQSPELQSMIAPISGESTSMKIKHISESVAELEMIEPPYIKLTLRKNVKK